MNEKTSQLTQIALHLDSYPNTPYCTVSIQTAIKKILNAYVPQIRVAEDHLAIYVHYAKGCVKNKLVVDSHLDHPGFILKDRDSAVAIGSIGAADTVERFNANAPVPVRIFDPQGLGIAEGELRNFDYKRGRLVAGASPIGYQGMVLPNSQAQLLLPALAEGEELWLRSADNHAVTAVALVLLNWLCQNQPNGNVTFIFTKLEEVKQVSATLIARANRTPFGMFDDQTYIIVLEAASVGQTAESRQVADRATT